MRCPACDAPALTEDARFCVGCGAELPEVDDGAGREAEPLAAATPPSPATRARRSVRARAPASVATSRDPNAEVPVPVVIGGVVVLLVIVLLILLAG